MKVLAVSDVVNRKLYSPFLKDFAKDVDLIVSCGDLPAYYLDFLVSTLGKPLLYVCGNHDHYHLCEVSDNYQKTEQKTHYSNGISTQESCTFGGLNLDRKIEMVKGLIFAGLEGSMTYNFGDHQYTEFQMGFRIASMKPKFILNRLFHHRFLDVLVTHAPPRGIHDQSDPAHLGFEVYLKLIQKYRPKYLLHGHTHLYDPHASRMAEYYGTRIINCYDYQILDLTAG